MEIRLLTKKDDEVVMNAKAKPSAALSEIVNIAECEVNGGYADYARVTIDGEVYAEYEA